MPAAFERVNSCLNPFLSQFSWGVHVSQSAVRQTAIIAPDRVLPGLRRFHEPSVLGTWKQSTEIGSFLAFRLVSLRLPPIRRTIILLGSTNFGLHKQTRFEAVARSKNAGPFPLWGTYGAMGGCNDGFGVSFRCATHVTGRVVFASI